VTVNVNGTLYCVPISPVREGEWLYFHCAYEGHKIDNLRQRSKVCISCVGIQEAIPGKFILKYESAVIFGLAIAANRIILFLSPLKAGLKITLPTSHFVGIVSFR